MADDPGTDVHASALDISELLKREASLARSGDEAMKARVHARARRTLGITPGPSGGGGVSGAADGPTEAQLVDAPPASGWTQRGSVLRRSATYVQIALVAASVAVVLRSEEATPAQGILPAEVAAMSPETSSSIEAAPATPEIPTYDVGTRPDVEEVKPLPAARVVSAPRVGLVAGREELPPSAGPEAVSPAPAPSGDVATPPETGDLASERAVIADLRSSMNRGDFARAEKALDEHVRRFPQGQLVEQRKALEVWLLEQTGKQGLARERAEQFKNEHPNSVMLRALGGS